MQNSPSSRFTIPVIALLVYVIFTFFPLIYTYLPVLGQLKIVLFSGIVMFASFLFTISKYQNQGAYSNPVFVLWCAILGLMVLGILFSLDRGATLTIITANLKYFLVFTIMIRIIDSRDRLDFLLFVFCACGVLMSASTIRNYFSGSIVQASHVVGTLTGGYRAIAIDRGLFGDPNDLALLNNALLPFIFYFVFAGRKIIVSLAAAACVILANVLTFSRGGFLGMMMVLTSLPVFFSEYRKRSLALLAILAVFILVFAPASYWDRISTITEVKVDQETGKTGTRLDAWKLVLTESMDNPFMGVGAGNSYYISGREAADWHAIHNSFLQVLSELGVFALIFFLLFYVIPFKKYSDYRRVLEKQDDQSSLILYKCTLISFLSYATTILFLPQAYNPLLYMLSGIWIIQSEGVARLIRTAGYKKNVS